MSATCKSNDASKPATITPSARAPPLGTIDIWPLQYRASTFGKYAVDKVCARDAATSYLGFCKTAPKYRLRRTLVKRMQPLSAQTASINRGNLGTLPNLLEELDELVCHRENALVNIISPITHNRHNQTLIFVNTKICMRTDI